MNDREGAAPRPSLSVLEGVADHGRDRHRHWHFQDPSAGGDERRKRSRIHRRMVVGWTGDFDRRALLCRTCGSPSAHRRRVSLPHAGARAARRYTVRLGAQHRHSDRSNRCRCFRIRRLRRADFAAGRTRSLRSTPQAPSHALRAVNLFGSPASTKTQIALTLPHAPRHTCCHASLRFSLGRRTDPSDGFSATANQAFGLAMILVLVTYGGWNETAYLSAELKDVRRNMVYVLVFGTLLLIAIYTIVNFAFLASFGLEGLRRTDAVGADLMRLVAGDVGAILLSAIVVACALSTLNATIFTGARVYHAMGRDLPVLKGLGGMEQPRGEPGQRHSAAGCHIPRPGRIWSQHARRVSVDGRLHSASVLVIPAARRGVAVRAQVARTESGSTLSSSVIPTDPAAVLRHLRLYGLRQSCLYRRWGISGRGRFDRRRAASPVFGASCSIRRSGIRL